VRAIGTAGHLATHARLAPWLMHASWPPASFWRALLTRYCGCIQSPAYGLLEQSRGTQLGGSRAPLSSDLQIRRATSQAWSYPRFLYHWSEYMWVDHDRTSAPVRSAHTLPRNHRGRPLDGGRWLSAACDGTSCTARYRRSDRHRGSRRDGLLPQGAASVWGHPDCAWVLVWLRRASSPLRRPSRPNVTSVCL
jgi:hypothetical protein